jgi:hypothetical protein
MTNAANRWMHVTDMGWKYFHLWHYSTIACSALLYKRPFGCLKYGQKRKKRRQNKNMEMEMGMIR